MVSSLFIPVTLLGMERFSMGPLVHKARELLSHIKLKKIAHEIAAL